MSGEIGRGQDDEGRRWYETPDGTRAMSVTTVLGFLEEDTTGLERWQAEHDGSGDTFHHEHVFWYSGPRGTLCHYQALCAFEDAFDGDDMWGAEEAESMEQIMEGPSEDAFDDASTDLEDVTYSILKNQNTVTSRDEYDALFRGNTRLVDVLRDDTEWFVDAFSEVREELGVADDDVIAVERFMLNDEDRYGGQCDLLYEDANGNVVLADLKTSSSLRQKHRLQGVAYKYGVEQADDIPVDEVDRVEVWRLCPDTREWQVHSHTVPEHAQHLYDADDEDARYTDMYWFEDKWGEFEYEDIEDMWATFTGLADEAHETVL